MFQSRFGKLATIRVTAFAASSSAVGDCKRLDRLGLFATLTSSRTASSAAFFSRANRIFQRTLPQEAVCISRFNLDALLAETFCRDGGELRVNSRYKEPLHGEGVVQATGRRAQAQTNGFQWYGLKAHATNVALDADLEVHLHADGYVGLCRLAEGRVNVCGLFRRKPGDKALPRTRAADADRQPPRRAASARLMGPQIRVRRGGTPALPGVERGLLRGRRARDARATDGQRDVDGVRSC